MRKKAMKYVSQVTELSTEKVELGAVQDFERAAESFKDSAKRYEAANTEFLKDLRDFNSLQQKIKLSYKKAASISVGVEDSIKNIEKIADKVAQAAKELGVKPSDIIDVSVVNDVSQVEGGLQNFKSNEDLAKKIINI